MKNFKIILVLLNILLFSLIYYTLNNNNDDLNPVKNKITDLSKVHKIEIQNKSNKLTLVKKNLKWEISSPIEWSVDDYSMSYFRTTFTHLKFSEMFSLEDITKRGEIIADYGINESSSKIVLESTDQKTTILVGKITRDEKSRYCAVNFSNNEHSKIWRVSEEIIKLTNNTFLEWADTTLIRCGLYQIDNISATFKSNNNSTTTTTLVKHKNQWLFEEPFKSKANNNQVQFLINNLLSEEILDFYHENDNNISFNQDENPWIMNFAINKSGIKHEFKFSDSFNENLKPFRLCKTSYSSHILKIKDSFFTNFYNWSTKLRERNIFQINEKVISKIKITNKNNSFQIIKSVDGRWVIKDQFNNDTPGDIENINALIQKLNTIEIKEFLSFNPTQLELKSMSDIDNNYLIQIINDDTEVKTIVINKNILNASLWKTFILEDSLLCLVDEDLNEVLDLMVYQLRNRQILQNCKIKDVTIFDLESNNTMVSLKEDFQNSIINEFQNFKVQSFINNKGKNDGTWSDGDWVPWRYKFKFNNNDNIANNTEPMILISEILGGNKLLGKFTDDNLTFNASENLINQIRLIKTGVQ